MKDTVQGVSIIIPARNEESCLRECLETVTGQDVMEVIVVDDHSTDRTRAVAESVAGVRVIFAPELPAGWSGKCNACAAGAREAKGKWLLFTDADTVHLPGSLARAVAVAEREELGLLSYSPEQIVETIGEKLVQPLVFAELASEFRPSDVNDPRLPAAAANGQFLLISREAYDAIGGHEAVATEVLEDVAIAKLVKAAGYRIRLKHGAGEVRTRMYRSFGQLVEGWTKNLALLFDNAPGLAMLRALEFTALVVTLVLAVVSNSLVGAIGVAIIYGNFLRRIIKAHFGLVPTLLSVFGLPIFAILLVRSHIHTHVLKKVRWKGRDYPSPAHS